MQTRLEELAPPWEAGLHRRPSRSVREVLGLSRANLNVIRLFVWLWVIVEAVVIFLPFVF